MSPACGSWGRATCGLRGPTNHNKSRTYAVGVLAGARGPLAPENLLFPSTCGGIAATGGWKKKRVLWRALPSKPPNRVTPKIVKYHAAAGLVVSPSRGSGFLSRTAKEHLARQAAAR